MTGATGGDHGHVLSHINMRGAIQGALDHPAVDVWWDDATITDEMEALGDDGPTPWADGRDAKLD